MKEHWKKKNDSEGWQPSCLQPQTAIITSRLAQWWNSSIILQPRPQTRKSMLCLLRRGFPCTENQSDWQPFKLFRIVPKDEKQFSKKASHENALTSEALTAAAIAGKRDNGSGWSSISPGLVIKIIKRTVSFSVWADRAQDNCGKRKTAGVWSSSALAPSDHGLLRKRVTTCSFASTILTTHHQHDSFCSIWLITYAFCCHLSKQKTAAGTDLTEKESSPTAHCCHTAVKSSIRN